MRLKPSLANFWGFIVGLLFIIGYQFITHRDYGSLRPFNDAIVSIASATGTDAFTVAMIMGAAIVLGIKFIVTHVIEGFDVSDKTDTKRIADKVR